MQLNIDKGHEQTMEEQIKRTMNIKDVLLQKMKFIWDIIPHSPDWEILNVSIFSW